MSSMLLPPGASKRLLHTKTFTLHFDSDPEFLADPRYAILSHRWFPREITFETIASLSPGSDAKESNNPQIAKVRGACQKAQDLGLSFIWIDSCCICRSNPAELSTAINSMFQWYRQAEVCITYLSDVSFDNKEATEVDSLFSSLPNPGHASEWFSRGWTLQELLAPSNMLFFDRDWQSMGTRLTLAQPLAKITGIPINFLNGQQDFRKASVASKMSWQSRRTTSRIEDMAYSMLGILGVKMEISYGRGANAFMDLQLELLKVSSDESLFAWTSPEKGLPYPVHSAPDWKNDEWGLLAPSPSCFLHSGDIVSGEAGYRTGGGNRPNRDDRVGVEPGYMVGRYHFEQGSLQLPIPSGDFNSSRNTALLMCTFVFLPCVGWPLLLRAGRKTEFMLRLNCFRREDNLRPIQISLCRRKATIQRQDFVFRRQKCSELSVSERKLRAWATMDEITILQPLLEA